MKISEVSKKYNLPADTLRYYEKLGLIDNVTKESGVRNYSEEDCSRIEFIICMKHAGLSLEDIKRFIDLNKLGDKELSLDLLNDLKADTITSVGTLPSIQDIMEGELDNEEKEPTGEMDLDKSFFTSAYSFGKDDFEFDENGEVIPRKKHTGLKIVIIILVILILACIGVGVYFLIK